jgi:hypothetical protein
MCRSVAGVEELVDVEEHLDLGAELPVSSPLCPPFGLVAGRAQIDPPKIEVSRPIFCERAHGVEVEGLERLM